MNKRFIFQNTTNKWVSITSINRLIYTTFKNMAKYCSKYYTFKASIKKQNITIKDALKIWMLSSFSPAFKIYLTIVNNWIQKDKKLEKDKVLFKAIEKEKVILRTNIKLPQILPWQSPILNFKKELLKIRKSLLNGQNRRIVTINIYFPRPINTPIILWFRRRNARYTWMGRIN